MNLQIDGPCPIPSKSSMSPIKTLKTLQLSAKSSWNCYALTAKRRKSIKKLIEIQQKIK